MALRVLDGNQSATTLSSVVTGGEHIVAHSVVSLGATAISNITSAVSGSVVTIPNLARLGNSVATDGVLDTTTNFIKIGGHQSGANQTAHIVHVSNGGAMSVDASGSSVTFGQASVTFGAITGSASILNFPATQTIAGTVAASNLPVITNGEGDSITSGVPIAFYDGSYDIRKVVGDNQPLPVTINPTGTIPSISGTVTANVESGTILYVEQVRDGDGNTFGIDRDFPISGTVTANVGGIASGVTLPVRLFAEQVSGPSSGQDTLVVCDAAGQLLVNASIGGSSVLDNDGQAFVRVKQASGSTVTVGNSVTIGSLPAISGTVTANATVFNVEEGFDEAINQNVFAVHVKDLSGNVLGSSGNPLPISGTVTANLSGYSQTAVSYSGSSLTAIPVALQTNGVYGGTLLAYNGANTYLRVGLDSVGGNSLAFGGSVPISGTVTIGNSVTIGAMPNGVLTTRFGTPTTANTAFATSAVTNTSRKYLLIQNVTTGSNVITVGIGFTPTTTQGIQLTAGAGITFESSYIPTGAVQILSSVTASNFTILEA